MQWLMIRLYGDLSPSIHIDIKHALQWLMIRLYGDLSLRHFKHALHQIDIKHASNMHSSGL